MSTDSHLPALSDDAYDALLTDLRAIITTGRGRAAAAVNAELVMTYWKIGERIVREEQGGAARAGYGEQLLVRLDALSNFDVSGTRAAYVLRTAGRDRALEFARTGAADQFDALRAHRPLR